MGPRDMDTSLVHRQSTKQLINRYESISIADVSRPVSTSTSNRASTATSKGVIGKKDKSPLRQSFSNLLSVFKVGKGTSKDSSPVMSPSRPSEQRLSVLPDDFSVLVHGGCMEIGASEVPSKLQKQAYLFSGTLLYLSRPSTVQYTSPTLPVWTTCTTSLKPGEILLTMHGSPSTHIISLANCTDVRSLSLNQLDLNERAMLPTKGDTEELKVFEILFEGHPREKFAATSVQERAGWVSAIW
jgi:hypothetical protein